MKGRYLPKENGYSVRKGVWDTINWANSDTAIAKFLGVTPPAVIYQRKKRGIPAYYKRGIGKKARKNYQP